MKEKITGVIEVGVSDIDKVVINHPDLNPGADGAGHIVFSPNQARKLAEILQKYANLAEESAKAKQPKPIPVNYDAVTLTDGSPVTEDHREIEPSTGMQKGYVVLSAEERANGFVRPVRRSYKHLSCGSTTTMGIALAETYARCPDFYSGTFCSNCREHYPLDQFVWSGTTEQVGS